MQDFRDRLARHAEHIKTVNSHCTTEETTKQALILPLLDALGFSPYDPTKVQAEYGANLPGIKANERVDYALFVGGQPVMFIEAKACTEKLTNHTGQLARYFASTPGVSVAAITNGREWRFFSDRQHSNIMDTTPFLTVNFDELCDTDADKLSRFRFDKFNPDGLRTFAEEQTLLEMFTGTIETCLRDPDAEFVKFVAGRSDATGRLTQKQIEAYTPIVKQALVDAISKVVVGGLSAPAATPPQPEEPDTNSPCETDLVDPDNPKIGTTTTERRLLAYVQAILDGKVDASELVGKDTESYYSVCYQGKVNRWLLRYWGDKSSPHIMFNVPMTSDRSNQVARSGLQVQANNTISLSKTEHLMKLSGIIVDALEYCQDDENFRKKGRGDDTDDSAQKGAGA
jgi:predicted type IV restriction endonuclease